jgi:hypothetical protein
MCEEAIEYAVLTGPRSVEAVQLVANVFSSTCPLSLKAGLSSPALFRAIPIICPGFEVDGLSVVALENGRTVGVALCDLANRKIDAEACIEIDQRFRDVLAIIEAAHTLACGVGLRSTGERAIHLGMVAVESTSRSRNVATNLFLRVLQSGKDRRLVAAAAECTSAYSKSMMLRHGGRLLSTVSYSKWRNRDGELPFADIAAPHDGVSVIEMKLD